MSKKCGTCEHCEYFGDLSVFYCNKYKGTVDKKDVCIEVVLNEM